MPQSQPYPFGRLTARSGAVLAAAENHARRFHVAEVDPEHLLHALADDAGLATLVLAALPVPLDRLRRRLARNPVGATPTPTAIPLSVDTRQTLELAEVEAIGLGTDLVGTEALLLALASRPETAVAHVLAEFGATHARLLHLTRQILDAYSPQSPAVGQESSADGGVERRSPALPADLRDLNAMIVTVRCARRMAIVTGDVDAAAAARATEKRLLATKATPKRSWVASVGAVALIDELDRMYEQTERLRHLVREKITGSDPESPRG